MLSSRCFAHIVNLAVKAVISAVTALNAVLLGGMYVFMH